MNTFLKTIALLLLLIVLVKNAGAQNPISPPGVYIADPSARVFNGTLYLYGSTDKSCDYWCSHHHDVLFTNNMATWGLQQNVFGSKGQQDEVPYNNELLFAPDCAQKGDTFFLYYCQPANQQSEGVATANSPKGPFTKGSSINLFGHSQIDPAVFIDDDGTAYYLWGQFSLKMARLKPNMREIDSASLHIGVLTEKGHHFHEGPYLTKHNGMYYLVYADISREDKPTCLGYATSETPFGP
ncbi:MAG: family 43 glycosylhydrolase [Bacteroidales bacterium]|nr:family 43 glycosylhydrolase [Bacteroidales bacterium]